MIQQVDNHAQSTAHIPLWRRITALFGLGGLAVIVGTIFALAIGATALLMVLVLEQAIG